MTMDRKERLLILKALIEMVAVIAVIVMVLWALTDFGGGAP